MNGNVENSEDMDNSYVSDVCKGVHSEGDATRLSQTKPQRHRQKRTLLKTQISKFMLHLVTIVIIK